MFAFGGQGEGFVAVESGGAFLRQIVDVGPGNDDADDSLTGIVDVDFAFFGVVRHFDLLAEDFEDFLHDVLLE